MKLDIYLKSGQTVRIDCESWETSAHKITWTSKDNIDKLVSIEVDQIAAVVRRTK